MATPSPTPGPRIERHAAAVVREALGDTRAVVVGGARQVGKSTLVREIAGEDRQARFVSLDDEATLLAARTDPASFLKHDAMLVIDEIQRAPEIYRAIKVAVDRDPRPGRFLLTGSANVWALPRLADALTGRMEVVELWPFSQGELAGRRERFIDRLFTGAEAVRADSAMDKAAYLDLAGRGGYPEAVARRSDARRGRWFASYAADMVRNDVAEFADIERLAQFPRILRLVAARTACVLNVDQIARDCRIPSSTMRRYLALLDAVCLTLTVPAWSNSRTTRSTHAPKLYMVDSGLAVHLLGASAKSLATPPGDAGPVIETFVAMEIRKQIGWAGTRTTLHHYRTREGLEVDLLLEAADGRIAGIEVKAGAHLDASAFRGLRHLREKCGDRFVAGVVLTSGEHALSFGEGFWAVPISALWE